MTKTNGATVSRVRGAINWPLVEFPGFRRGHAGPEVDGDPPREMEKLDIQPILDEASRRPEAGRQE